MSKTVANIAAALILCAPLAVALVSLIGHEHRWPDILTQFPAPALGATVALLLVLCLLRLWPAAGFAGAVAGLLLLALQPQWFPAQARPVAGQGFSLYVANLWARNQDIAAMRRSIEAADADVLVLIEFGDAPHAAIDQLLAGYPHRGVTRRHGRGAGGPVRSVIASRLPLNPLEGDAHEVETAVARIDTPFGPVTVMGVHLTRPWPFQYQWGQINQADNILARRATLDGPVVIAGDFNSTVAGRIGRKMRSEGGLTTAGGYPGTWPVNLPAPLRITIDQVYHTPDLVAVERRLGLPTGSDHRPVVVAFRAAR